MLQTQCALSSVEGRAARSLVGCSHFTANVSLPNVSSECVSEKVLVEQVIGELQPLKVTGHMGRTSPDFSEG